MMTTLNNCGLLNEVGERNFSFKLKIQNQLKEETAE